MNLVDYGLSISTWNLEIGLKDLTIPLERGMSHWIQGKKLSPRWYESFEIVLRCILSESVIMRQLILKTAFILSVVEPMIMIIIQIIDK